MASYIDIVLHVFFSFLAGFLVWKLYGNNDRKNFLLSIFFAFIAGVLIDLDHFIDNFIFFDWNFNFDYFIRGEYFVRSGKNYILFHGFEYVLILFVILKFFAKTKKAKMIVASLVLAMLLHLLVDIFFFSIPLINYSILYRIFTNFAGYN